MRKDKWFFESKYIIFYFTSCFDVSFELCGYFDNRPRINLALFVFNLTIILPFRNKWTDECVPPKWGVSWNVDTLFIYKGGKGNLDGGNKWWTFQMPWSWDCVRTSALRKDGTWENEYKLGKKKFWKDSWNEILWSETFPYAYTLRNGEIQERLATVKVEEREWRWRGLKWLSFPKKLRKTISVEFNEEVGERTGSWKGGVTGCGYDLKKDETPLECLRRMEKERKFN